VTDMLSCAASDGPMDPWADEPEVTPEQLEAKRLDESFRFELRRLRAQAMAREAFAAEEAEKAKAALKDSIRVFDGASFLLDLPDNPPAIWGNGDDLFWAEGESLMLAGPQGVGKTTIAGQLIRGLIGLQPDVLGFPMRPVNKRVGYLAMDRPQQARRALGRMFSETERSYLEEALRFWNGPLPADAAVDPQIFVRIADQLESEALVVDSMKDVAVGLSKDEVGAGYNRARQFALAEGVQLLELHHVVKNGADGKAPNNINGIYGSTWLTSGCGSVIMLWGEPGDPIVDLRHLKQPMNELGPFKVRHNRETGISEIFHDEDTDVLALARRCPGTGLTAVEAAQCMFQVEKPTTAQVEKARRKLAKFVDDKLLTERAGGGSGPQAKSRWFPVAPASWGEAPDESEAA